VQLTVRDPKPNIWLLQAQRDSQGLLAALQTSDPDTRRRAAAALRAIGAVEAIPALRRLANFETDPQTREHLQMALEGLIQEVQEANSAQAEVTRQLVAQLKSTDPALLIKAARDLGRLKDKTAVESLVLLFHNKNLPAEVRLTAAEALIALQSAPAVVTLLAALKSSSWKTRRSAAAVLGQIRADWAVARLADHLSDENEYVQRTVRAALRRIATPEALQALETHARQTKRDTAAHPVVPPPEAPEMPASPDRLETASPSE
jgi:HEAT repeat protein